MSALAPGRNAPFPYEKDSANRVAAVPVWRHPSREEHCHPELRLKHSNRGQVRPHDFRCLLREGAASQAGRDFCQTTCNSLKRPDFVGPAPRFSHRLFGQLFPFYAPSAPTMHVVAHQPPFLAPHQCTSRALWRLKARSKAISPAGHSLCLEGFRESFCQSKKNRSTEPVQ